MIVVEICKLVTEYIRIRSWQTGASKHKIDFVLKHVGSDASPQQLHNHTVSIRRRHTGTPKF